MLKKIVSLGVTFISAVLLAVGCSSEPTLSVAPIAARVLMDEEVVFTSVHEIDEAARPAFYAAVEEKLASHMMDYTDQGGTTVQIGLTLDVAEDTRRWTMTIPSQNADDVVRFLTQALDSDHGDIQIDVSREPTLKWVGSSPSSKPSPELPNECCVRCGGTTACGCAASCGSSGCCVGPCC